MAEYLTDMNAGNLLTALQDARQITPDDRKALASDIQNLARETELPLYLRVLAGVGAFIASLCILGFLGVSRIIDFQNGLETLFWAAIFITAGVLLAKRGARTAGIALHSFLMQWSFCCVGVGKIMAVTGATTLAAHVAGGSQEDMWYATFALAVVTAVTWPFYRLSIDRFLSSAAVLLMLVADILCDSHLTGAKAALIDALLVSELCFAAVLLTSGRVARGFAPLGYALVTGLCAIVLTFSVHSRDFFFGHEAFDPAIANVALAATLIALFGWASGGLRRLKQEQLLVASCGAALLAIMGAPGLILAVGLMVLGYARHDRKLITGGALLMPVFLWLYYYNLDLSLMAKAATLAGSGAVLLAGRGYMHLRKFDKEA